LSEKLLRKEIVSGDTVIIDVPVDDGSGSGDPLCFVVMPAINTVPELTPAS
jgi:hypothetical protein